MSKEPVSRMNYFSGEAPAPTDFRAEQRYHVGSREQLSRGVFSPGVVEGLDVQWIPGGTFVTVTVGMALDSLGRLLVLTEDTLCTFSLCDGRQNFVTIGYGEHPSDLVSATYGEGYKRWTERPTIACGQDYDPTGCEVLLAVIDASDDVIQGIAYSYGAYMRQHVSANLGGVHFLDESNPRPRPAASIALNQAILEIDAPKIKLSGAVTAVAPGSRFTGAFSGVFNGIFKGDGSALKLPSASEWTRDGARNLSYSEGKVTIGDTNPSSAYLAVRQGTAPARIGTGLISLQADGSTVWGYQTQFLNEVNAGDTLTYDYAPEQSAVVDHRISPTQLAITKRFPIDLGPSTYRTQRQGESARTGNGKVSACGTTLTCIGGAFPTDLAAGDTIVLDASSEDAPICLRVQSVDDDNRLTVSVVHGAAAQGGPKLSAFSVTPSILLEVGGVNPPEASSPPALAAAQNGAGSTPINSVAINSSDAGGSYAFDVSGPVLLEDDVQMSKDLQVDGALTFDGDLTVTDSLTVDHTAHQVIAQKDMQVVGDLTVGRALDASNGNTTLQSLEVTNNAKIDGTLTVGHLAGFSVDYFGARQFNSYVCPPNSDTYTAVSGETVQTDGILTVCLDTTSLTCNQGFAGSLALSFDGVDAAMENFVAIWTEVAITASNRSKVKSAGSRTLMIPLKKNDTYKIQFRTNDVDFDGVKVDVCWTSFAG